MPGLLDIAKATKTIPIQGVNVSVYGISARGIAVILDRFPIVRQMFTGKSDDITSDKIVALVPEAISCIIACGTGAPGDKDAEAAAELLPAGDQADLLQEIIALTMPKGAGPFVEKLMAIAGAMGVDLESIRDTKLQPR